MGEPQHLTVAFDDAIVDGLVDRRPGLPVVTGRADQPFPRVGGGSDQPAHPPDIRRQPPYAAPHEITEASREGNGLLGEGHVRVVQERTGAFQGVERVSAARVIQPGESVPGQHRPQP